MHFLLDTHTFLWWLSGNHKLSLKAREAISNLENEIFVSSASAWEIATKYRVGKLSVAEPIANNIHGHILSQGFKELEITVDDGQKAGLLVGIHRDPFDRMLIAQSQSRNLTLVSDDSKFRQFDVKLFW